MAEDNSDLAKLKKIGDALGKPILESNSYRMSYGNLNYLRSNKAIFYFDRGIRGKQNWNSMYPLEQQPKYKDLVVFDYIVFTFSCKCDSANQHKEMFQHYRVTCAVGLTCPARLNNIEKTIYARDRNDRKYRIKVKIKLLYNEKKDYIMIIILLYNGKKFIIYNFLNNKIFLLNIVKF